VRVGASRDAFYAFIPNPLPPPLDFDKEFISILSGAAAALGELSGLGRQLPNPHLLVRPFIRREATFSSRIKGTQSNLDDLFAFEVGQSLRRDRKVSVENQDVEEVLNYARAMEYGTL